MRRDLMAGAMERCLACEAVVNRGYRQVLTFSVLCSITLARLEVEH